ncbi:MAG: NUDIX domain-containing protein, partial [Acidobacteriota bacterium]
ATELREEVSGQLQLGCSAARTRALGVAAIRELSEETGLILGRELASRKNALEAFADAGLAPDLGALHLLCRAVTPPQRPKRFNARFFIAEDDDVVGDLGGTGELVDLRWWTLPEARKLDLPKITQAVLAELQALLDRGCGLHTPQQTALFKTVGRTHRKLFESRSS